jgi:hypothetical protein
MVAMRWLFLVGLLGCATAVGGPDPNPGPGPSEQNDAAVSTPIEAGQPAREGTYFGDYVVAGNGGTMMLDVKEDGFVTLWPKDVNASGTGTIDDSGHITVSTGYDQYSQGTLYFTGVVTFDGTEWRASGKVGLYGQSGTWSAIKK